MREKEGWAFYRPIPQDIRCFKKIILYVCLSNLEYYHLENFAVYVLEKYSPLVLTFIYAMMSVESLITSTTC